MTRPRRLLLACLLFAALARGAAAAPVPGWRRIDVAATGSYLLRYVPRSLVADQPAPVVIFLHGAGGTPEAYQSYVLEAAERAAAVVVLPKSLADAGWGADGDETTVAESLRLVKEELSVDARRVAIAGHSAGGAYAYLLAYGTLSRYSAVFTLSASFYAVATVADPAYKAPIRMYYGTTDPNYTNGPYAALKAQWQRLGVPWEEDIQPDFGHNSWPLSSMIDGFLFLVGKSYPDAAAGPCLPGPTRHCLGGGRFAVEVAWRDFQGHTGAGTAVPGAAADSGLFWFFAPDNWELLVKVLDGCAVNGRRWVFAAATTSVEYDLTVTDTVTGHAAHYHNPLGRASPAITDIAALDACRERVSTRLGRCSVSGGPGVTAGCPGTSARCTGTTARCTGATA
jgi:phospholipase/carboxylesterase